MDDQNTLANGNITKLFNNHSISSKKKKVPLSVLISLILALHYHQIITKFSSINHHNWLYSMPLVGVMGSLSPVEWLSGATPHLPMSGGDVPNVQQLPSGPASAAGREFQNLQDPSPLSPDCFEFQLRGCLSLCFEGSASSVQEHGGGRGPVASSPPVRNPGNVLNVIGPCHELALLKQAMRPFPRVRGLLLYDSEMRDLILWPVMVKHTDVSMHNNGQKITERNPLPLMSICDRGSGGR